ncbi:MAG: DUF1761 domain-containing protein [Pseudomonadota bacterium]|jgi:hypothetical protein
MYLQTLNWLAIIVATLAAMAVGGLWYSPAVAGKAWMALTHFNKETAPKPGPTMAKATVANFILAILMAGILARMGYQSLVGGAGVGAILAALVIGPAVYPNYAFEGRSMKLFALHMGNTIIAMTVMGAIIGAWR